MTDKMSPEEIIEKCLWEGGIHEGLIYGLNCEMIDDSNPKFKEAFREMQSAFDDYQFAQGKLERICDDLNIDYME